MRSRSRSRPAPGCLVRPSKCRRSSSRHSRKRPRRRDPTGLWPKPLSWLSGTLGPGACREHHPKGVIRPHSPPGCKRMDAMPAPRQAPDRPLRVVVAEDAFLAREAIEQVLTAAPDMEVVALCENIYEL